MFDRLVNMTFREKTLSVGIGVGLLFALLTSQIQALSTISSNVWVGAVQVTLMSMILPGMFLGMTVTGNVHDFEVWVAVMANAVFYFLLCLAIGWVVGRFRGKRPTSEFRAEDE